MNLSLKNGLPWCNMIFFYLLMGIPLYAQISPSKASDIPVDLNTTSDTAYEISRIQGKEYAFTLVFKNKRTGEIRTRITSEELMQNNPFYALDYPILSTKPNGERIYDLRGLSRNKRINILSKFKLNPEFNGYEIDSILPNFASLTKTRGYFKKNIAIIEYYLQFYLLDPENPYQLPLGAIEEIVLINALGQEINRWHTDSYVDVYPSFDGKFIFIKEVFPGGEGSFGWKGDLKLVDLEQKKVMLVLDLVKGDGLMDCLECYFENSKFYMNFENASDIISLVVDPHSNKYYIKKYLSGEGFSHDDYYRIKKI